MDLKITGLRCAAATTLTVALALAAVPAHAESYVVEPGDTVSGIAASHGTTVAAIVQANGLDARATIYAGQHLEVPSEPSPAAASSTHVVTAGESLWSLAALYGTSVKALSEANGLTNPALIRIGQELSVPAGAQQSAATEAEDTGRRGVTHAVVGGDTVWDLAQRYGVSVVAIIRANRLTDAALIREGELLAIPGALPGPSATPAKNSAAPVTHASYVVTAGDTVADIARRYGTTVDAIADANSLSNPSLIRVGQVLAVPGGTPTGLVGDTFLGRTYPADVVAAANVNKATLNGMDVPTRAQMQQLVVATARDMGVDTALAQAIAYQESGFNQRAVSPANAIGCMQVIPTSGEWASGMVGRNLDLLNPNDNVVAGVAILRHLTSRNDLRTAIASYYQGERSVRERGMNADTVTYVDSVIALMERFD